MPECDITVGCGSTLVAATVRDQAELFGLLERLRNLSTEIVSVAADEGPANRSVDHE